MIPPLLPPHPEIAPTELAPWEQYGLWIVVGIVALAVLAVLFRVFVSRRPPATPPIEVQIRQELVLLRGRNADGRTLSRVSRCVRRYFADAFELPRVELTTAEFLASVNASEKIGADLAARVDAFLRRCDELRFGVPDASGAPASRHGAFRKGPILTVPEAGTAAIVTTGDAGTAAAPQPAAEPEAAVRALELLELGEARRAQLRRESEAAANRASQRS